MSPWTSTVTLPSSCLPQGWAWLAAAPGLGPAGPLCWGLGLHPRSTADRGPGSTLLPAPKLWPRPGGAFLVLGGAASVRVNDCSGRSRRKSLSLTEGPRGGHLCLLVNIRHFHGPLGAQVGTTQLHCSRAWGLLADVGTQGDHWDQGELWGSHCSWVRALGARREHRSRDKWPGVSPSLATGPQCPQQCGASPQGLWRLLFSPSKALGHLDMLRIPQQEDGGSQSPQESE